MKKFIVAAVLAIVLSFSLVVPAFAETPVRIIGSYYYYPYSGWSGSGFGGGTHTVEPSTKTLTEEDFLSLYYGAVESNSNSYSFSLRQSGSYTFIAVYSPSSSKVLGRLCDSNGLVYRCASIVHSELFLLSSIPGYIDQIEGRLARTVNDITYTVADSTYNTWKTLESMSGTLTSIAARMSFPFSFAYVFVCFHKSAAVVCFCFCCRFQRRKVVNWEVVPVIEIDRFAVWRFAKPPCHILVFVASYAIAGCGVVAHCFNDYISRVFSSDNSVHMSSFLPV